MSLIASDGLSLLVGDGGAPETFNTLRGMTLTRFDLTQKLQDNPAVSTSNWASGVAVTNQRLVIEVSSLATDEAAALRVRSLALSGNVGNFKLELTGSSLATFAAFITRYRETIAGGEVKTVSFTLTSSGAASIS